MALPSDCHPERRTSVPKIVIPSDERSEESRDLLLSGHLTSVSPSGVICGRHHWQLTTDYWQLVFYDVLLAQKTSTAFLSYSRREDSDFAVRLAEDLKKAGAIVWLDRLDIRLGERWDLAVGDALKSCPTMLVILSPASVDSTNVMDEVAFALEKQKKVIPVLYRDCEIPFRLLRLQHADFTRDYDQGLKDLLECLLGGEQQSVSPSKPKYQSVRELRTLTGHSDAVWAVTVTPDGKQAVSASYDKTLKVWELSGGRELRTLIGHTREVTAVAVTPDGQLAVSASWDKTLKVWELASGRELRTLGGHTGGVTAVAVTPNGKLAVSASRDHTLKVWHLESGHELRTLNGHTDRVIAVAATRDGKLAISASNDKTLKVWELGSGRELRTLSGHSHYVASVAVTPDDKLAVSASWDQTLRVWDLDNGLELRTLTGNSDYVNGAALTPDGQLAVSASLDKTLKVWELDSGRELLTFTADAPLFCCAVAPDGRTILAGDERGTIHCLRLE